MPRKTDKSPWTGEALKVRRRVLSAINTRIPKGCISELGRLCTGRDYDAPFAAYAAAMGWTTEQAKDACRRHITAIEAVHGRSRFYA